MEKTGYPFNYGGLEANFSDYGKSRYVVLPVPYERTTTYGKGAAKGPRAIIDASCNMELYDEELDMNMAEEGIATIEPLAADVPPEEMVDLVRDACARILSDGKFPVVLGGEHSISLGAVLACKEFYPELSVLQLDAHADLRDSYGGSKHSHACVMKRIREHVPAVQAGIRSLSDEESVLVREFEDDVFYAMYMMEKDLTKNIVDRLGKDVYVTFDVDFFDPSIMPSTGTPEPGGFGWYDALKILRRVMKERNVAGFDAVELAPNPLNKAPDFTVAKLVYKMMGYVGRHL
ncbi:MAG: agmatinase [Candidatus Altiarchaeota archaeon]|nr:agmatinase [Candidatus Altiarchaeota archaeon]